MPLRDDRGDFATHSQSGLITYEADWYSGSQIQVLMGDILIDNAVAITYQVNSTRIPIYGFGSEYFAFTAKGHTLVTGQLTIAFKETQYLLSPAKRFHNMVNIHGEGNLVSARGGGAKKEGGFESLKSASGAAHRKRVRHQNVEQMLRQGQTPSAGLVKQLGALGDSDFENYAEEFEDVVWYGANINSPRSRSSLNAESLSHDAPEIDSNQEIALRRLDQYPPVDITITFGDMEAPDTVNHTVQKLLDVHFTGEVKEIVVGGQPILETYSFIARNRV